MPVPHSHLVLPGTMQWQHAVLRQMFRKISWDALLKGQAGRAVKAPDLQPFDVPIRSDSSAPWMGIDAGVAGPSRCGHLHQGKALFQECLCCSKVCPSEADPSQQGPNRRSTNDPASCTLSLLLFERDFSERAVVEWVAPSAQRARCSFLQISLYLGKRTNQLIFHVLDRRFCV